MKPTIPLTILFLLCIIISTQSKTIYVSNTHEGTGNGTISNPFRNLTQAFDHYNHEDIYDILIQPGVYNETIQTESMNIVFKEGLNLSVSKMDFEGVPGEVVVDFLSVVAEGVSVNVKEIVFSGGLNVKSAVELRNTISVRMYGCSVSGFNYSGVISIGIVNSNMTGYMRGDSGEIEVSGSHFSGGAVLVSKTGVFTNTFFRNKQISINVDVLRMDQFLFEDIWDESNEYYPLSISLSEKALLMNGEFRNCVSYQNNFDIRRPSAIYFSSRSIDAPVEMENVKFRCNKVLFEDKEKSVYLPPIHYINEVNMKNVEAVDCVPTCEEGYYSTDHILSCDRCDYGSEAPSNTSTSCTLCPPGSYRKYSTLCQLCPPGSHASGEGNVGCSSCMGNTIASHEGTETCTLCDSGVANKELTECQPCPAGQYFNGFSDCDTCIFFLTSEEGSTSCNIVTVSGYFSIGIILALVSFIGVGVFISRRNSKKKYSQLE